MGVPWPCPPPPNRHPSLPTGMCSLSQLLKNILNRNFKFEPEMTWSKISKDAMDFIQKLLVSDPSKRLAASEALMHPWIHGKQRGGILCRGHMPSSEPIVALSSDTMVRGNDRACLCGTKAIA